MAGAVKHDYHLVEPSPWPFVASVSAFILAVGAVVYMAGLTAATQGAAYFALGKGQPWIMLLGTAGVLYTMFGWWGDIVKESRAGDHTPVVEIGLRYGMILFIVSEVMFFVAWFWVFFEGQIYHDVRIVEGWIGMFGAGEDPIADQDAWSSWPPKGVEVIDPFHLPLLMTLLLLTSGTTVTWAHHAHQHGLYGEAKMGLLLTVILGVLFSFVQVYEYSHAGLPFGGDGATLYTASFYMATGFHGFHVVVGTIFLLVCLLLMRRTPNELPKERPFALDAAAWYWHFVDVVWLFLFAFVYVVTAVATAGV